jgi:hypothetical protein
MRVIAPIATSLTTKFVILKPTFAQDPLRQQYKESSHERRVVHSVGMFQAYDPANGAWPFSCQQRGILKDVLRKITPEWVASVLIPTIDTSDKRIEPSLRLLDWFVTNYSKSHGTTLKGISIHADYVDTRRAYQCRHFDPFRRNLKIRFESGGETYFTTVGQVNFVLWADKTAVLDFVKQNRNAIDTDMANVTRKRRRDRYTATESGQHGKRIALSKNRRLPCRIMRCHRVLDLTNVHVSG